MGILFNNRSWRTPLLMIDSWLPRRAETPTRRAQAAVLQRFVRAGWLGRHRAGSGTEAPTPALGRSGTQRTPAQAAIAVRRGGSAEPWGSDSRVVIAGRMRDVCAELDRLVAMEQRQRAPSR